MKNYYDPVLNFFPLKPCFMKTTKRPLVLHQLIDQLLQSFLPHIVQQKSFIVNDIKKEMLVCTDENILASVLSNLLSTTINYTQNNCIRISAKLYGNIILLHVKDNDNRHDEALTDSLLQVEPLAEKIGGCITISNNKMNGTTVAVSFYNQQLAA